MKDCLEDCLEGCSEGCLEDSWKECSKDCLVSCRELFEDSVIRELINLSQEIFLLSLPWAEFASVVDSIPPKPKTKSFDRN